VGSAPLVVEMLAINHEPDQMAFQPESTCKLLRVPAHIWATLLSIFLVNIVRQLSFLMNACASIIANDLDLQAKNNINLAMWSGEILTGLDLETL
jgi:hypothetical protein